MSGRCLALPLLGFAIVATGCAKEPVYYPVAGNLTLNGKPMTVGRLQFVPDLEKGNTSTEEARARVDPATGQYSLKTEANVGCQPGWYKVVVFAFAEPGPGEGPKPPIWIASTKYADPKTTPFSVEVTASPASGQYDFDLKP